MYSKTIEILVVFFKIPEKRKAAHDYFMTNFESTSTERRPPLAGVPPGCGTKGRPARRVAMSQSVDCRRAPPGGDRLDRLLILKKN